MEGTQSFVTMPKGKNSKKNKGKSEHEVRSPFDVQDMPSEDLKQFLVEFLVKFYEENSAMALESKFLCYGEESINKFKTEMEAVYCKLFMFQDGLRKPRSVGSKGF